MSQTKPTPLIGRLAVQLKMISPQQLSETLQAHAQGGGEGRLGDLFAELGLLSPAQLKKLNQVQRDVIAKHRAKQAAAPAEGPAAQSSAPARSVATAAPEEQAAPTPAAVRAEPEPAQAPAAAPAEPEPTPARLEPEPAPQIATPAPPASQEATATAKPEKSAAPPAAIEGGSGEPSLDLSVLSPTAADRERLHQLLSDAMDAGASDIHIHSGSAIQLRVHGQLAHMGEAPLSGEEVERMISASLSKEERIQLARDGELDLCLVLPDVGRFRANVYRQQRGFDAVLRTIPNEPPTLEQLGLPADLATYTQYHQGMVLITGPAGCGKSSTMAALVNLINEERQEHILCVEDPIEYVHQSKKCFVNQRHAGRDTQSFARALRGALREDPDVIVIGELRDLETISLAMTAAETGHFVLATLHTNNAVRTVNRMIGAFPSNQQSQVRTMLSESLRAVISQRLVPRLDETGRVAALEVLVINKAIGNLIRDEKTIQIRSAIQTGTSHGMYLLEQSLNELVASGTIDREVALSLAEEKKLIQG